MDPSVQCLIRLTGPSAHGPKCAMPDEANKTFGVVYVKPKTAQNDPCLAKTIVGKPKTAKNDPDVI